MGEKKGPMIVLTSKLDSVFPRFIQRRRITRDCSCLQFRNGTWTWRSVPGQVFFRSKHPCSPIGFGPPCTCHVGRSNRLEHIGLAVWRKCQVLEGHLKENSYRLKKRIVASPVLSFPLRAVSPSFSRLRQVFFFFALTSTRTWRHD